MFIRFKFVVGGVFVLFYRGSFSLFFPIIAQLMLLNNDGDRK